MDTFTPLLQELGDASIVGCGLYQLYVALSDRQESDIDRLVWDRHDFFQRQAQCGFVYLKCCLDVAYDDPNVIDFHLSFSSLCIGCNWTCGEGGEVLASVLLTLNGPRLVAPIPLSFYLYLP